MHTPHPTDHPPAAARAQAAALQEACRALWTATLSLMSAYMQQPAPAHRLLLARRIARNFATLTAQDGVFSASDRASFARLARRWEGTATRLSGGAPAHRPALSRLASLLGLH